MKHGNQQRQLSRSTAYLLVLLILPLLSCSAALRVGVSPFYRPAPIDEERVEVLLDVAYRDDADADPEKHRLDLYLPSEEGWPVMVFVHGGSLLKGDKDLKIGSFDIYGNIGRFYAARGIGVAVVNYRLQPEVRWPEQADDVAAAVAWVTRYAPQHGGDGRVYLAGHSAGAWLAARVALDRERLERVGLEPEQISGVIAVSGSGYQMTDSRTWEMYSREHRWAERFDSGIPGVDWHEAASVVPLLDALGSPRLAPPFLLMCSTREWAALVRQNRLFYRALQRAGIDSELFTVRHGGHRRMVFAMSHDDKTVSAKILEFIDT